MRMNELFRTCANEHVAAAALACIGGAFERRIAAAARRSGLTAGAMATRLLEEFDHKASPKLRAWLEGAMEGQDMPILAGLRRALETVLEGGWDGMGVVNRGPGVYRFAPAALRASRSGERRLHS